MSMADIIDIPKIPGTYHGNKVRHRDRYKFIRRARVHFLVSLLVACVALPLTASVLAQSSISSMTAEPSEGAMMSMPMRADGHVPLGVTGGDFMTKGNWMISYRYMRMEMDNNLIGHRQRLAGTNHLHCVKPIFWPNRPTIYVACRSNEYDNQYAYVRFDVCPNPVTDGCGHDPLP